MIGAITIIYMDTHDQLKFTSTAETTDAIILIILRNVKYSKNMK